MIVVKESACVGCRLEEQREPLSRSTDKAMERTALLSTWRRSISCVCMFVSQSRGSAGQRWVLVTQLGRCAQAATKTDARRERESLCHHFLDCSIELLPGCNISCMYPCRKARLLLSGNISHPCSPAMEGKKESRLAL